MLKRDLIEAVAARRPEQYRQDIAQAVDIVFEEMARALAEGKRIEIRGFGSFAVRTVAARDFRNPANGNSRRLPERKTVKYTMSKALKNRLMGPG